MAFDALNPGGEFIGTEKPPALYTQSETTFVAARSRYYTFSKIRT